MRDVLLHTDKSLNQANHVHPLPGTFHPHVDPDTFYGVPIRDILNVWNEGVGTEPERCAVLVAALCVFNVPGASCDRCGT